MKVKQNTLLKSFVVVAFCFSALGLSAQSVTKTFKKESLANVLKEVERQTGMSVIYKVDEVNANKKITASFQSASVREVLEFILDNGLSYEIENKMIIIHRRGTTVRAERHAQQGHDRTVKGSVLDEKGEPIIGATVTVKGSKVNAVTDLDGNFTITAPEGSTLVVSYLGYKNQEVSADSKNLRVSMSQNSEELNEVVVTALGIKKEAKALTYNVQQLSNNDITGVKDANFMNALLGKVAGVQINASSSGIGGGVKVVMRGAKSITNNNNALYVIDGIPMPSLQTAQPSDYFSGQGQSGDGASMINPEDIESMSVLSGAAASALYGSEAQNGVIMIRTKRGKEGHTSLTYSNNTSFFSPFITPEFQNTYGAAAGEFSSWGDKFGTPSSYNPLDFFQTGYNVGHSVSLSTGTEKNQTFVSAAATNAEGIVKNNMLDRYNFAIRNTSSFLQDKMHLDLSAMYMNVRENNMVSEGQYMNPIVPVYLLSPSYSLDTYQVYEMYDADRNFKTQYWPWGNMGLGMQNPYWIEMRDNLTNHKNRFMISAGLSYDIAKGITLGARAKMDYTSAMYEKQYAASTDGIFAEKYGYYEKNDENTRQLYGDIMLNIDKYFGDWSLTGAIGTSIQDVDYKYYGLGGNLNSVANDFTFKNMNISSLKPDESRYHDQTQSIFATAQLGWQSKLYLDMTGRIDWASALAWTKSSSVAYPSVGLTAILTDLIPGLKSNVVTFMKIRGSYSEVGNAPKRYVAYQTYPYQSAVPSTSSTYPNNDIKPERTKAWEVGFESHFWGNKLNLNVSLYKTSTYNQLFNPTLPSTSGYKSIYINGGRIDNKGIEASLTLNQPLGPVNWTSSFTYTINRNKVVKLLKPTTLSNGLTISQDHLDLVSIGNVKSMIKEGGSMGDLYVTALATDFHGFTIVDYVNNTVSVDKNAGEYKDGYIYAGNSQAKYTMGWRNSFSWKGLTLGFLINARIGGVGVSMTQALMDANGVSKRTADARDAGGVMINGALVPKVQAFYQTVGTGAGSYYVYSATNVRLGELTLGYDVPITKWVPWMKGLNVAFTGRNLLMFYSKAPYDPELTASTGTGFEGMDYFMLPSLRNLGFSVRVNF
ncbi:SusC/RagA family TonB-linked outer membrane protein [Prevotella sp.]|uniref:SusC/RagA family TonB-linked outer membrane protein n=1 Tax=Prevotella sp. TaxID=59823 RepID=UPI002F92BC2C